MNEIWIKLTDHSHIELDISGGRIPVVDPTAIHIFILKRKYSFESWRFHLSYDGYYISILPTGYIVYKCNVKFKNVRSYNTQSGLAYDILTCINNLFSVFQYIKNVLCLS